ncbi:hypothetical protein BT67DRAFT_443158 [Trichocladium antarcticum]|uniref:Uncharacterized protein n=1 Tax=Trichocladium antarcticum TaxID=1450529 RepID=A0AAN6UK89_9PEZI|nr:hypothetical protein BT67DRAFT_443158 [Trichocladium antarcticum]
MNHPEIDAGFNWGAPFTCMNVKLARPIQTFDISFSGGKPLSLVEKTTDDNGRRGWSEVHVQGAVIFRKASPGTPNSAVSVEIVSNDDRLPVSILWDGESQALQITVPQRFDWGQKSLRPGVNIKATVWVPEDGRLETLRVEATHLDIKLLDNLSLSISQQTWLLSTVGSITAASTGVEARDGKVIGTGAPNTFSFYSRMIQVKTTSADITGSWPLYDYLLLQSMSGNVRVWVAPKDANGDDPRPAILSISSISGDVQFREPIHGAEHAFNLAQAFPDSARQQEERKAKAFLPPRDYRVDVHTASGNIGGVAAFSSSANFRSTSGDIDIKLLPVLDSSLAEDGARDVKLSTGSTSGSTVVTVLDPLWVETDGYVARNAEISRDAMLRCMYSSHTSTSANIRLWYPESWEGDIALSALSGELKIGGEGVKLIKKDSSWPGFNKSLLARKGEQGPGGKIEVKSTSGDLAVWVGAKSK